MIVVVVLVAVWAGLTFQAWYREWPTPAAPDRDPGWALRQARTRRTSDIRIVGPVIVRHHPSEPRRPTWTVHIPDPPTGTLPLDLTERWPSPWDGLHTTLRLQAVE